MFRPHRPLTLVRRGAQALAIALMLALAVPPVTAGLRDKIKSVKDKAIPGGGQKPGGSTSSPGLPPAFDDRTLELTGTRLDQLLKGLKAAAAITADRAALVVRRDRLQREMEVLQEQHGEKLGEYVRQRDDARQCLRQGVEEGRKNRFDAMMQKGLSDPNSLRHIAEVSVRLSEARVKGDSVAIRKSQAEMEKINAPTREDTLAARKQCGPGPAPFAPAIRFEAAQAEYGAVYEQIRGVDFKANSARSEASGLTEDQVAIAVDRTILYLAAVKKGGTPSGFTDTELQALASRKDALASALGV